MDDALHKAISDGQLDDVRNLLTNGANINNLYGMTGTPLCAAIYAEQPDIVDLLLEHQCDINAKDYDGEPPLCLAIRKKKYDIVERLLKSKCCDVNRTDPIIGCPPLHVAVNVEHLETVHKLISCKCKLDATDKNGSTAMDKAIKTKNETIAKCLIDSGCSLYVSNNDGLIPLYTSMEHCSTIDIMRYILEKMLQGTAATGEEDVNKHSVLNYRSYGSETTPLSQALTYNNPDAAMEFITRGCDLNLFDRCGKNPLMIACQLEDADLACKLLEAGADPNMRTQQNGPPIFEAIKLGKLYLVKKLLEYGANILALDRDGKSVLCYSLLESRVQIADYIIDYAKSKDIKLSDSKFTIRNHPLIATAMCTSGSDYFARRLIALGFDVNFQEQGATGIALETPLSCAIEHERYGMVKVLLARGANPDTGCLQIAAGNGCLRSAVSVIQWGADINSMINGYYETSALYFAISNGNIKIAKVLLECGALVHPALLIFDSLDLHWYCTDEEQAQLEQMLQFNSANPQPLSFQVRNVLRSRLRTRCRLKNDVELLQLPAELKDFIRHKELDVYV